jgi:DNA repair exonuclease SbcCD ATPase subunit
MTEATNEATPLTLHRVTVRNLMRLEHVEVDLAGEPVVIVGGDNEQGKTSFFEAIRAALGGGRYSKDMLRQGERAGLVELDLGDGIIARRTWTRKAGQAEARSKVEVVDAGEKRKRPQELLDAFWSKVAIDLTAFERMDDVEQADHARRALGIDWTGLNAEQRKHYDARTDVNRDARATRARLDAMDRHESAPDEEVSAAELMAELERRQQHNAGLAPLQQAAETAAREVGHCEERIRRNDARIAQLERELAELRDGQRQLEQVRQAQEAKRADTWAAVDAFDEQPVDDVKEQLRQVDSVNAAVRSRRKYRKLAAELDALEKRCDELNDAMAAIDREKEAQLAAARFPIPGLSFDADGLILLDGLPLRRASHARRLRAIIPLAFAVSGRAKILLIGEDRFDAANLALVAELCREHGGQVVIERVGDQGASFVLEAGKVRS